MYGYYRPYSGYILVVGTPWYDRHYGYYYDGQYTYRGAGGGGIIIGLIIAFIAVAFCCLFCYIGSKHIHDDDIYEETVVVHETTYNDDGYGPKDHPPENYIPGAYNNTFAQSQ